MPTDEIFNEDPQELKRTALKQQHITEQLHVGVQAPSPNQTRLPP